MRRIAMPRTWPIARKGKPRYILQPKGSKINSIAVLVVLRDMLNLAKTRKEARMILREGNVLVNGKKIAAENFPLNLFDVISVPMIGKNFVLAVKGEKMHIHEINEKEASARIFKIIGKRVLNDGKIQFNLVGGINFISGMKANVGDSVLWDFKQNKPAKQIPLKENAKIIIVAGKNAGIEGIAVSINGKDMQVKIKDKIMKIPSEKIWVIG